MTFGGLWGAVSLRQVWALGACCGALALSGCSGDDNSAGPSPDSGASADGSTAKDGATAADSAATDSSAAADGTMPVDGGPDGTAADGGGVSTDAAGDGVAADAADASAPSFSLLVAETPPGPTIAQNLWGGVLHYNFTTDDAGPLDAGGIDASEVADPVGLAFRPASSEVFVGNRHGNNAGDGVAGSVSRFVWNGAAQTLTPNGTITGNGLNSVTQVAFNPVSGELFAANYTGAGGVSRFTFDSQGNATPNGTIGSGAALGVNVSPDGKRLYLTVASSSNIAQFDLSNGTALAAVTVSGTTNLQQIALRGSSELYIASGNSNTVFRFTLDASDNPTLVESITGADAPIGVAFSPDGLQMFTGGHLNADIIDRYQYSAQSNTWTPTTKFMAPASLGYMLVVENVSNGSASSTDASAEAAPDAGADATLDATPE